MTNRHLDSIRKALEFLRVQQHHDGFWYDFRNDVGISSNWVTGYTLVALDAAWQIGLAYPRPSVDRASQALKDAFIDDRGWGYNSSVQTDADSTAWCILGLSAWENNPDDRWLVALERYQSSKGGFRTFVDLESHSAWSDQHSDVSAAAARAMLAIGSSSTGVIQCLNHLLGTQRSDGRWDSYWYIGSAYATVHAIHSFRHANISHGTILPEIDRAMLTADDHSPFQLSMLGMLAAMIEHPLRYEIASLLLGLQARDGRWISPPFMRVTDPQLFMPWTAPFDSGAVIYDQNCIFSTASAVMALCELVKSDSGGGYDI